MCEKETGIKKYDWFGEILLKTQPSPCPKSDICRTLDTGTIQHLVTVLEYLDIEFGDVVD